MPSIEEIKDTNDRVANVRKSLHGSLFVGPMSAEVPATLFSGEEITLPEGYRSVGLVEKSAGFTVGKEMEAEDVEALGYGTPVRQDVTTSSNTIGVTALETNAVVRELVDAVDLSNLQATGGEVTWDHPDIPPALYYRVLVVSADGSPGNWVYSAEVLPRARVSETGEVSLNTSDATQYEITFTGLLDSDAGFSRRSFIGGSGFDVEAFGATTGV